MFLLARGASGWGRKILSCLSGERRYYTHSLSIFTAAHRSNCEFYLFSLSIFVFLRSTSRASLFWLWRFSLVLFDFKWHQCRRRPLPRNHRPPPSSSAPAFAAATAVSTAAWLCRRTQSETCHVVNYVPTVIGDRFYFIFVPRSLSVSELNILITGRNAKLNEKKKTLPVLVVKGLEAVVLEKKNNNKMITNL